jgi:hypothetical protein
LLVWLLVASYKLAVLVLKAAPGPLVLFAARIAAATALVPGLAVLGAALNSTPHVNYVVVVLAFLSVISSGLAMRGLGLFEFGRGTGFTKAAVGVAAVVAIPLFTFWQQASYLPAQNQPNLTVTPTAMLQTASDKSQHIVITVKVENKGQVRDYLII